MNAEAEFRAAMAAYGLSYGGPIHADGRIHRVKSRDDKQADTWYILYLTSPAAGAFGSWRLGIKGKWRQRTGAWVNKVSECTRNQRQRDEMRAHEEALRQEQARLNAADLLTKSHPANLCHGYLVKKGVGAHGELMQLGDLLVLPLRDIMGRLNSLQFITADGTKRFLSGGRTQGCFFSIGADDGNSLVIVEGYATGATIFAATKHQTICAMNCGNLMSVALAVRAMWPSRDIIIAADDDQQTPGNPGLTRARAAAEKITARLCFPSFTQPLNQ